MIVQGVVEEYNYTTTTYKGAKKRTETTIDTTLNISGVWRVHLYLVNIHQSKRSR